MLVGFLQVWSWSLVEKPPFHSASTSADCLEVPMRPTAGLGWRINLQEPQQTWLNNAKNHGFLGVECSWNPSIDWFYIHVHLFWWPDPYLYFLMFYFLLDPHSVATHDQFFGHNPGAEKDKNLDMSGQLHQAVVVLSIKNGSFTTSKQTTLVVNGRFKHQIRLCLLLFTTCKWWF